MNALHARHRQHSGPAWGAWVKLATVESTEMLADAGFDFCVVDLEHTMMDPSTALAHVVVAGAQGMRTLVRVPDAAPSMVQRVLDAGADGVVMPHVDHPDDARAAVAATRFPPEGRRGSGATSRAGRWGTLPREDYLARATVPMVQIESAAALADVEAIAAVPGVGGLLFGPADLTLDAGGDLELGPALTRTLDAARAAGVLAGTAGGISAARDGARQGLDFAICANDATLLATKARELGSQLADIVDTYTGLE